MAVLFGGVSCVDPATLKASCDANGIPTDKWWGKANRFDLTAGREWGTGWLLLRKEEIDSLALTTDHNLTFSGEDTDHVVTLSTITLRHSECITPGAESEPAAVYLCEVVDRRYHLARVPIDKAYNVSNATGAAYLTQTLNSGTAWTWQEITTNLAVTTLGLSTLTLPFTPHSTPENLIYYGTFAWTALNDLMDRIGCSIQYNPVANTFSIIRVGSAPTTPLTNLEANADYKGRVWDGYCDEPVRAWRPEKVRVRFPRRPQPSDGSSPFYNVDVTLSATTGVKTGTFEVLYDDLTALGATGTPSNSATLSTRATERSSDWLRVREGSEKFVRSWRDFQPLAVLLPGQSAAKVIFDDRGGLMRTHAVDDMDASLANWKPLDDWPVWWPISSASFSSSSGHVHGIAASRPNATAVWNGSTGSWIKQVPIFHTATTIGGFPALVSQATPSLASDPATDPTQYQAIAQSPSTGTAQFYQQTYPAGTGSVSQSTGLPTATPTVSVAITTAAGYIANGYTATVTLPSDAGQYQQTLTTGTSTPSQYQQTLTPSQFVQSYDFDGDIGTVTWASDGGTGALATFSGVTFAGLTITGTTRTEGTAAAAGSTQGDATQLTADANKVTGADGTKGVILTNTAAGIIIVWNSDGGNSLKVYPPSGAKIGSLGTNNPQTVAANSVSQYARFTSTEWAFVAMSAIT